MLGVVVPYRLEFRERYRVFFHVFRSVGTFPVYVERYGFAFYRIVLLLVYGFVQHLHGVVSFLADFFSSFPEPVPNVVVGYHDFESILDFLHDFRSVPPVSFEFTGAFRYVLGYFCCDYHRGTGLREVRLRIDVSGKSVSSAYHVSPDVQETESEVQVRTCRASRSRASFRSSRESYRLSRLHGISRLSFRPRQMREYRFAFSIRTSLRDFYVLPVRGRIGNDGQNSVEWR